MIEVRKEIIDYGSWYDVGGYDRCIELRKDLAVFHILVVNTASRGSVLVSVSRINTLSQVYEAVRETFGLKETEDGVIYVNGITRRYTNDGNIHLTSFDISKENNVLEINPEGSFKNY